MTSISDVIGHYQRSIEKSAHDEARLLHCIEKLYKLPVTVEHLQQTGIGKTVNSLRKYDKEVGVAAKTLVAKWKAMVAAEEEIADEDDDGDDHKSSDDGDGDGGYKPNGHSCDRQSHNERIESPSKRHHDKSASANSEMKERKSKEEHSRHSSSHSSDRHSRDKSSNNEHSSSGSNKHSKEVDRHRSNGKLHDDRRRDEGSNNSSNGSSRKSRLPPQHVSDHDHVSDDDEDEDEEKLIIDTEKEVKVEQSSKHSRRHSPKPSSSHDKTSSRSSKNSTSGSSRSDHHRNDREKEKDKKESSKKLSSSSSSPSKTNSSHDKSDKGKTSDDRHRLKTDRKDGEKSSRVNGDHKSLSSPSSTSSKSSKHHEKSKESKESDRKTKSSSSKSSGSSNDKDKSSSSKDDDQKSSKRKHEHTESSNSDDEQNVLKKTKTKSVYECIDSSAGTFSFEEALGMMAPPSKPTVAKLKSTKLNGCLSSPPLSSTSSPSSSSSKSTPTRSGSSSSSSRSKTPPLLTAKIKLEPLDPKLSLELPIISNNYKPLPLNPTVMDCVFAGNSALKAAPPKRTMSDAEALQSGIQSKTIRTKIYSGVKTGQILQVPTLYNLCIRVLQKNIDALEYTGDVPYDILKPVLELATPQQLQLFEEFNPYILIETDELWEKHCNRRYKSHKREEMESWREMFVRCQELEAQRLSALTKNISIQQKQIAAPVRKTQLAYVDMDVKPPRNVQRKQEQYGTKGKMIATPAARVEALSKMTPSVAKAGDTRLRVAAADTRDFAQASSNNRPKKAPLMQKTLQLMRGRFKR